MLLLQLIVLLIIIFGVLVFILRQVLTTNISSATSHLDSLNADFARREEEIKKRQIGADKYYDEMVNKTKDDVNRLRQEADKQLQEERDKILENARVQSEEIILKAEKTKEMIVNELRREMQAKLMTHLRELFSVVFPAHIQGQMHALWLEDLLQGDLSRLSQMRLSADIREAKIISAFVLSDKERDRIRKKIKEHLGGRELTFVDEVDAALIGGIVVVLGSIVLDGTIAHKLEEAIAQHDES